MSIEFDAAITAPFRMQPGLRRMDARAGHFNLAVQAHRGVSRHLREKLAVLWCFGAQALCRVPGFDEQPALMAAAARLAQEHPQAWQIEGPRWHAPMLGWAIDATGAPCQTGTDWPELGRMLADQPPEWRRAVLLALAVQEDLAILDAGSGTLPWLAVALPSMWAPEEKIGRHFTEVHAPVADNRLILQAADRLMALVTAGERWERFVWTLTGHPRLHAHPRRVAPERWAPGLSDEALAAQTWMRTERQTFLPVAGRRQAVFTIQVATQPLTQALVDSGQAARLHDALATMSDPVLAYRGLAAVQPALLRWLAARATG